MPESYNLVNEHWIPCLMLDESEKKLSIQEVFTNAHKIKTISDHPTNIVALYRFLLSIIYRVEDIVDVESWIELWNNKQFNEDKYNNYLNTHKDGFDLLDPVRPFYQTPGQLKVDSPIASILEYKASGNNPVFFSHNYDADKSSLTFAQAAVAIINHQAFGFTGGASTTWFNPDNTEIATGGRRDSVLSRYLVFLLRGDSLFEDLLLNFVPQSQEEKARDTVPWEETNPQDLKTLPTLARGTADLYTWQARRISLKSEANEGITRVSLAQGREYTPETEDPMKLYSKDEKFGWMAYKKRPGKAGWRDLEPLLMPARWESGKNNKPPKTIEFIGLLAGDYEEISYFQSIKLDIISLRSEPGKHKVYSWHHEKYLLPLIYLSSPELFYHIKNATTILDAIEGILNKALYKHSNRPLNRDKNEIRNIVNKKHMLLDYYWAKMELHFISLLNKLPQQENLDSYFKKWAREVVKDIFIIIDSYFDINNIADVSVFRANIVAVRFIKLEVYNLLEEYDIVIKQGGTHE